MSDEQQKDDEPEVEGHRKRNLSDEPTDEAENEVEAHVVRASMRMD